MQDKIWDKLGDLMLLGADEPVDKTPEATMYVWILRPR